MHHQHVAGAEIRHQIFGAAARPVTVWPFSRSAKSFGKGKRRFLRRACALRICPFHRGLQAAPDGLDFGQFRHAGHSPYEGDVIAPLRRRAMVAAWSRVDGSAGQTTHFGFGTSRSADKQTLVNDVFHSVARRYDLMNDLMSVGMHRLWKDIMITALNPPKGDSPFALLDVAGGTGDISFRAAKAAGSGFHATVCDINTDMLEVGRTRAAARASRRAGFVRRGQCRGAGVRRSQFRRLHHRVRHPQCAADRSRA